MANISETDITEENILPVVVLYNRRLCDTEAYKTLLRGRRHAFIQDNSPESDVPSGKPESWRYVRDVSNPGISAAYNAAARYARENGFRWLFFADQDTTFPAGMLTRLETLAAKAEKEDGYRAFVSLMQLADGRWLSPVKRKGFFAKISDRKPEGEIDLRKTAVINSGLMVRLDAFFEAGGYNEKVFLDFSDFQFIDRLAEKYPKAMVTGEVCRQQFSARDDRGEQQLRRFSKFCESLAGYETKGTRSRLMLKLVVLKRCLRLMLNLRSLEPVKIMFEKR